jgi:hypothetical protein
MFILARICHGFGMDRPPGRRLRAIGMIGSGLVLIGLAGWALSLRLSPAAERAARDDDRARARGRGPLIRGRRRP